MKQTPRLQSTVPSRYRGLFDEFDPQWRSLVQLAHREVKQETKMKRYAEGTEEQREKYAHWKIRESARAISGRSLSSRLLRKLSSNRSVESITVRLHNDTAERIPTSLARQLLYRHMETIHTLHNLARHSLIAKVLIERSIGIAKSVVTSQLAMLPALLEMKILNFPPIERLWEMSLSGVDDYICEITEELLRAQDVRRQRGASREEIPAPPTKISESLRDGGLRRVIQALESGRKLNSSTARTIARRKLSALKNGARKLKCEDREKILAMLNRIPRK
jgi:hypothetical protein